MVYVDNARGSYRGMKMCHMVADTRTELLAMAAAIGVEHRWIQCKGSVREHFDICATKRAAALRAGAKEATSRELGEMILRRRAGWLSGGREAYLAQRTGGATDHA